MNLDELLNSNTNLEDYLNEYGYESKFIYYYYKQDLSRMSKNYYGYGKYLTSDDKTKLLSFAIDSRDYEAINIIMRDVDNLYLGDENFANTADKIFAGLIKLDEEGKIDLSKINGSVLLYRSNPIYFVKKDPKYIRSFYNLKREELDEILKYLASINYTFVDEDRFFVEYSVLSNTDTFIYFVNNCKYDPNVDYYLITKFKELSKEEMLNIYPKIKNSGKRSYIEEIVSKLNLNNYDYDTIIKEKDICLTYDPNKKEDIFNLLNIISKNGISTNVILVMQRVDMDIVNQAYAIIGDNLKIMPLENQMSDNFNGYRDLETRPYYDFDYIKKSEDKLNLYASMVNDTKDKDGEIKSLSPLEKYIAAYILTSKFAPYKEVDKGEEPYKSRSVYEFINSITNTKIVCTGYAHLLREILFRMGIKDTIDWSVETKEDKEHSFTDHTRMMIHLTDSKYDIDGIYMADPTLDSSEDTQKEFSHMLMSHDELLEVDSLSGLTYKMLRANETLLMESRLHVNNAFDLFRKPIPKEALVKAHLAVEHFLDKNMKMVNDGNYDLLEYHDMAAKLHFYEIYQSDKDKLFGIIEKMSINELKEAHPNLLDSFFHDLYERLKIKVAESGIVAPLTGRNDIEEDRVLFGLSYKFKTEEFTDRELCYDDIKFVKEFLTLNRINEKTGEAKFFIQIDNNRPINEQYEEIINKLKDIDLICQNITSNNKENNVK